MDDSYIIARYLCMRYGLIVGWSDSLSIKDNEHNNQWLSRPINDDGPIYFLGSMFFLKDTWVSFPCLTNRYANMHPGNSSWQCTESQ